MNFVYRKSTFGTASFFPDLYIKQVILQKIKDLIRYYKYKLVFLICNWNLADILDIIFFSSTYSNKYIRYLIFITESWVGKHYPFFSHFIISLYNMSKSSQSPSVPCP